MEERELRMLIEKVKEKVDSKMEIRRVEYMLDFGAVSVMISMSYN